MKTVNHIILLLRNFVPIYFEVYTLNTICFLFSFLFLVTKSRCDSYIGKPYQFKCQNGNFALVQTEWSNFVNPWSGQVELITGRHKVIQVILNLNAKG